MGNETRTVSTRDSGSIGSAAVQVTTNRPCGKPSYPSWVKVDATLKQVNLVSDGSNSQRISIGSNGVGALQDNNLRIIKNNQQPRPFIYWNNMSWKKSRRLKDLNKLGHADYQSYLRSGRWQKIRDCIFNRDGGSCRSCGKKASCVHHIDYCFEVLAGKDLTKLFSLCFKCHDKIHNESESFEGMVNLTLSMVTKKRSRKPYCFTFGKFKGISIDNVSSDYLFWIAKTTKKKNLRNKSINELKRRHLNGILSVSDLAR